MAQAKLVPCGRCAHENLPEHSFCGMCGFPLPAMPPGKTSESSEAPATRVGGSSGMDSARTVSQAQNPARPAGQASNPAAAAPPREISPVREAPPPAQEPPPRFSDRPRTLGELSSARLRDDSAVDLERARYLLDEEPEPAGGGSRFLMVLLFFAVMGVAVWHWRANLRDLGTRITQPASPNTQQRTDGSATASSSTGTSSGADASAANANNVATNSTPPSNTPTASPNTAAPPASAGTPVNPPAQTLPPTPAQPANPTPQQAAPQDQSTAPPAADQNDANPTPETAPPAPAAAHSAPAKATPKPKPTPSLPAAAPAPAEDSLETEGENYLYGNGVPQNCDRAQKNLLAAASHADAKAYSVLGTMFATGHCAPRDLPLAYRWFAKALHQDPDNTRIADDLKALWSQMTPDERQIALRNQ